MTIFSFTIENVLCYGNRWPSGLSVGLSAQEKCVRDLLRSRSLLLIQYWLVPGSGLEND
jgi:hypothetical protein